MTPPEIYVTEIEIEPLDDDYFFQDDWDMDNENNEGEGTTEDVAAQDLGEVIDALQEPVADLDVDPKPFVGPSEVQPDDDDDDDENDEDDDGLDAWLFKH